MNRFTYNEAQRPKPQDGCPKCGQEQFCPCKNCADRNAGKVVWKWTPDGECISCGHCGFTAHADQWLDFEYEYLKSRGGFGKPI